jgi:DNA-binding beta-propeller fold protein YncE
VVALFTVTEHWPLAGDGKWDYVTVDPAQHRLYVSRETRVQILDTDGGASVGEISNTLGVHGIAVAPDLGLGFTSNGKTNSVTVFDLAKLEVLSEIKLSKAGPDAILYAPETKQVLTFNGHSRSASVIDAVTRTEVRTIDLPGSPEFAARTVTA